MNALLETALKYEAMGFSVIPIKPGEKAPPLVSWEQYQRVKPTSNEIKEWWRKTPDANIGIVTGKLSNLAVIDLDKYAKDYSETIALEYFPDNIIAPAVMTPRGGNHLYFTYPGKDLTINARALPGIDLRGEGGYAIAPPSVNGSGKSYVWILSIEETAPPPLPVAYINKINTYIHERDDTGRQLSSLSSNVYIEGRRDQDLFHIAHLLIKAGCEDEYLYKTLEILALNCNPPFSLKEANDKIKSAIDRGARKERNLTAEVREYVLSSNGVFLSSDVVKCLHLSSREDQKHLSKSLTRLCDEKLIEKYGNKNGCYRTIDQEEELIDIFDIDLTPYDIKLPLKIHEYVTIHKSNVIIIAGESNAGKTSFCLNVARMNRDHQKINYLSSEMQDGTELRIRINEFEEDIEKWRKIKFEFRTDDFPSKIIPDALNIVDYLDEGSDAEAYKMPGRIKAISKKLKNGVAVVAIQKDPNKEFGFGGSGTLNRSRLYLTTTTKGVMTIKKGKIWRNKLVNPNGMFCQYKLAAGCKYHIDGEWKW
jgi:hypothetical protein